MVKLIQRLSNACRVLQSECELLRAERDLFMSGIPRSDSRLNSQRQVIPTILIMSKGKKLPTKTRSKIEGKIVVVSRTDCCSLDATTATSINYCPNSQPPTPVSKCQKQEGIGTEATANLPPEKKQRQSSFKSRSLFDDQITITLASSPGLSECSATTTTNSTLSSLRWCKRNQEMLDGTFWSDKLNDEMDDMGAGSKD